MKIFIDVVLFIILLALVFMPIIYTILGSRKYRKLSELISCANKKTVTQNAIVGLHENIIVGDEKIDVEIVKESWRHYVSFQLRVIDNDFKIVPKSDAEINTIDIVDYIYNHNTKDINKYIKLNNKKEAEAIISCVFRTLDARRKNSKVNSIKIGKKHGVEVLCGQATKSE